MKAFFDVVRKHFGPLSQNQVDGLSRLVPATDHMPLMHQAYALATAWHETGPASRKLHMTPRREIWGPTAAQKRYEGNADLGNTVPGDGKRFMGRGYVQITGRRNYNRAALVTGRDLVASPDMALEPDIAAKILVSGLTAGWFTGKKLADFKTYRDMRRVVNGTDKADLIAGYAKVFEEALLAEAKAAPAEPVQPVSPPPVQPEPKAPEPAPAPTAANPVSLQKVLAWLGAGIAALVAYLTVKG